MDSMQGMIFCAKTSLLRSGPGYGNWRDGICNPVAYVFCKSTMSAQTQNLANGIANPVRLQGWNRFVGFLRHGTVWRNPSLAQMGKQNAASTPYAIQFWS